MSRAFLSIGTNLGDRLGNIRRVMATLSNMDITVSAVAPVYETSPWGFNSDHPFLNTVFEVSTGLSAGELLVNLMHIEESMGRERREGSYSSRIIDIDILFFDDLVLDSGELNIPHPRMHDRLFVLVPLNDIAPALIHPVLRKSISDLLSVCKDEGSIRFFTDL